MRTRDLITEAAIKETLKPNLKIRGKSSPRRAIGPGQNQSLWPVILKWKPGNKIIKYEG